MTRPPLANLFAVHDADPATLDGIMQDLRRSGEFAEVWRPAPGWVAAVAPLPGSAPDGDVARRHQLAFAEGRDVLLEHPSSKAPEERFRELAERADLHPGRLGSLPGKAMQDQEKAGDEKDAEGVRGKSPSKRRG